MEFETLFDQHRDKLEDFWGRRQNGPHFGREFCLFGRPIHIFSNDQAVLASVDYSQPLYSTAPATDAAPFTIQLVVRAAPVNPGPVPDNLVDWIQYTGDADWLAMQFGTWGHCHADLAANWARAVLTPQLARRPDLVSRCLLNTLFNNFLTFNGFSMLHATCLPHNGRVLLLMAPHNTGKSTTALRLALAGYPLMSDSQVYVTCDASGLQLTGFPVGRIKLRQDVVSEFPHLHPLLVPEQVRDETKYTLDLRQLTPALVCEEVVRPAAIELCLLTRSGTRDTHLTPATRPAVMEAVMLNSLFYDTAAVWRRNLTSIGQLVDRARLHHLAIGSDSAGIVATVAPLLDGHR
jgi:hypothetical protein